MSLVITPRLSSSASSRQISAISDDFPVPTGPATPSRRVRRAPSSPAACVMVLEAGRDSVTESGTEQPLARHGMDLGPLLDLGRTERRDLVQGGQLRQVADHTLDLVRGGYHPTRRDHRIERFDLEG